MLDSNAKEKPKVLAIIPARGGSKGIPKKNLLDVNGKSLIYWSIHQAINSGVVDYVHVSTDSAEIAEESIKSHARCEFMRPSSLSGDRIGTADTIYDCLKQLENLGESFDYVIELQPTYCLRGTELIKQAVHKLMQSKFSSLITVKRIQNTGHPDYCIGMTANGAAIFNKKRPDQFVRQDLSPWYSCHGVLLAAKVKDFLHYQTFYTDNCCLHEIDDPIRFLDIDNLDDYSTICDFVEKKPHYLTD